MGSWRAKSPFENNPFIDGFVEWMDTPEGQHSIDALDLVFDALEHAGVDARWRKIIWDDGKQLSIKQSVERIHAGHPDVPAIRSKVTSAAGSKTARPSPTPNASSRNSTSSSAPGSTTINARHAPPKSSRELRTLKLVAGACSNTRPGGGNGRAPFKKSRLSDLP